MLTWTLLRVAVQHLAVALQIFGQGDGGHAAGAEFALDGVSVGEGGGEAGEGVGHNLLRCSVEGQQASCKRYSITVE